MIKVFAIVGTRPEAIKMAPVVRELRSRPSDFEVRFVSTGQHRQMLDQVLQIFGLTADVDLSIMRPNQGLAQLTAAVLTGLDEYVVSEAPDWILGQGDTTSVMAASLVAFYRRIRFGHIEAGLRTGDLDQPFPEELNRRVADLVSTLYFAPTERSKGNLLKEGVDPKRILVTGNTVVDALISVAAMPFRREGSALDRVRAGRRHVLITAHRRESFGEPFRRICESIRALGRRFPEVDFVYPVHLNPNVRKPVQETLAGLSNVHLLDPLTYVELVHVMKDASLILTDSGGIQEEAPTFGVPTLVMRRTTERPEGIEAGFVKLVGNDGDEMLEEATRILSRADTRISGENPYGDGHASTRIADAILNAG
jgi:UDP-N-acetylglucosamine 2-epimerase (non-hydrolysing)